MKRMFALVAILTALLAGCAYGSGAGKSSGPDNPQPQPQTSYCSVFATNCGPQATQPVASADAANLGAECQLNYYDPTVIDNRLNVQGLVIVKCRAVPFLFLMTFKLQFKNSFGNWIDESDIFVTNSPPLPGVAHQYTRTAACYPGLWRVEGHWSGIKSDGKTHFPNPADGDTPADWASNAVRLSC